MKAIILAAGEGKRLQPLTNDKPKCLVELFGQSLLEHQINLSKPIKEDLILVNSYHNNILTNNSLGNNLKSFAVCDFDNTIEGIFHESNKIIGIMWHPERSQDDFNKKLIIKIFVENMFWNKI